MKVAVIDGLLFGAGVGLSLHAKFSIITENTVRIFIPLLFFFPSINHIRSQLRERNGQIYVDE